MSNIYVVIYTDTGDSCDGLARVLGAYTSRDKALEAMKQDVEDYKKENPECTIIDQQVPNWIEAGTTSYGCLWQILMVFEVK